MKTSRRATVTFRSLRFLIIPLMPFTSRTLFWKNRHRRVVQFMVDSELFQFRETSRLNTKLKRRPCSL